MKVKFLFLLFVIASLFSFVLYTHDTKVETKKHPSSIDMKSEKEPMQPFVLVDRNQFD